MHPLFSRAMNQGRVTVYPGRTPAPPLQRRVAPRPVPPASFFYLPLTLFCVSFPSLKPIMIILTIPIEPNRQISGGHHSRCFRCHFPRRRCQTATSLRGLRESCC